MHALAVQQDIAPVIIDVREPAEYRDLHLEGAINIPSTTYELTDFEPYRGRPIYLVCTTGIRVQRVKERLEAAGFQNVYAHEIQMQAYAEQKMQVGVEGAWTVDRQFRLALGILLVISLLGQFFISPYFLSIAAIICTGLTVTAIIDRCYFKMLVAKMPWNSRG